MTNENKAADDKNQQAHGSVNRPDPRTDEDIANDDANPPEKDMLYEGAPTPEEIEAEGQAPQDADVEIDVVDGEEDPIAALQAELADAQSKAAEYLDKMQRTAAEYQNSRRRQEKQMAEEIERANGQLIKRLLPVLDDFNLAFDNVPEQLPGGDATTADHNGHAAEQAWVNGFRQIHKKLLDTLGEQGLEMVPSEGLFDPNQHEAIGSEPSDTVESGHIVATLRAGYIYKGQVLRPALVRVAA